MKNHFKIGYVSFIGRPNAGKSTLFNSLLATKYAIVSNKPQTTREQIQAVYEDDKMQIMFIDTPGIHKHHNQLGKIMNRQATSSTKAADIICWLAPADQKYNENDKHIIQILKERTAPIFLLLTKTDLVSKTELYHQINTWKDFLPFAEIIPISAKSKLNLSLLIQKIYEYLPTGDPLVNLSEELQFDKTNLIREIIREKIIALTKQEIPYSVAVFIENLTETKKKYEISTTIVVEKQSQKAILLGSKGNMIKTIGMESRKELEAILGKIVYLKTFVKVIKDWRNNPHRLQELGYH